MGVYYRQQALKLLLKVGRENALSQLLDNIIDIPITTFINLNGVNLYFALVYGAIGIDQLTLDR